MLLPQLLIFLPRLSASDIDSDSQRGDIFSPNELSRLESDVCVDSSRDYPSGDFRYVPFEAHRNCNMFLGNKYCVTYSMLSVVLGSMPSLPGSF